MNNIEKALINAEQVLEDKNLKKNREINFKELKKIHIRELTCGILLAFTCCVLTFKMYDEFKIKPTINTPIKIKTPAEITTKEETEVFKDLEIKFKNINVKGIIYGDKNRILIDNKAIRIHEEIIPGIIFMEIKNEELIGRDSKGKYYHKKLK
jgi:hypothetical protein